MRPEAQRRKARSQADQKAREVVRERQGAYVHPFDQVETIK